MHDFIIKNIVALFTVSLLVNCRSTIPSCTIKNETSRKNCYIDTGHPRPLSHLVRTTYLTSNPLDSCVAYCAIMGYKMIGVTGHDLTKSEYYCYCDSKIVAGSMQVDTAKCSLKCPGNSTYACGANGYTSVYTLQCDGPLPPSPSPPGPPLPKGPACSQKESHGWKFCNTSIAIFERIKDLVQRITIFEAGSQLTARTSAAIPRLGIPEFYWGTNAIHGIMNNVWCPPETGRCPTSFPNAVSMAATFNMSLVEEMGATIGREMRALANLNRSRDGLTAWAPTINLNRDPRWGRNQETASECPYLSGHYGAAFTKGIQNGEDHRFIQAVSTLKHFVAYSLEDYDNHTWTRQKFNAIVSKYDLADSYFPAFEFAIKNSNALGIMYSCNEVNGVPSLASTFLDNTLHSWGFQGYRTTDGGQISQTVSEHHYVPTIEDSIAVGLRAEADIDDGGSYQTRMIDAFVEEKIDMIHIEQVLYNAFHIRFRLGLFDPVDDQPYLTYGVEKINDKRSQTANKLAARQALVLLKNNGLLPLKLGSTTAVIGPNSNSTKKLQGSYGGKYCAHGTDCFPSLLQAIQQLNGNQNTFYSAGCASPTICSNADIEHARAIASKTKNVVLVLGLDQSIEAEQRDRFNITLPEAQLMLFRAVLSANKNVAILLMHGGALAIKEIKANASAILDMHYPGVEGGDAVADTLFGLYNPGGKLPYTVFPAEYQDIVNFTDMSITTAPGRTYRYYNISLAPAPLWNFGFGLSYTTFSLRFVSAQQSLYLNVMKPVQPQDICVIVTNTGGRAGSEVVQAFFSPPDSYHTPSLAVDSVSLQRQLFFFERIHLERNSMRRICITVTPTKLALLDITAQRVPTPGNYSVTITRGHGEVIVCPVIIN